MRESGGCISDCRGLKERVRGVSGDGWWGAPTGINPSSRKIEDASAGIATGYGKTGGLRVHRKGSLKQLDNDENDAVLVAEVSSRAEEVSVDFFLPRELALALVFQWSDMRGMIWEVTRPSLSVEQRLS